MLETTMTRADLFLQLVQTALIIQEVRMPLQQPGELPRDLGEFSGCYYDFSLVAMSLAQQAVLCGALPPKRPLYALASEFLDFILQSRPKWKRGPKKEQPEWLKGIGWLDNATFSEPTMEKIKWGLNQH